MGKKVVFLLVLASLFLFLAVSIASSREARSSDAVKVIVYFRDAPAPQIGALAAHGIQKASISTAASIDQIKAFSGGRVKASRRLGTLNGFTAEVSPEDYAALKANPNLEVYQDGIIYTALDASVNVVNASLAWSLVHNGTNITGDGEAVCVIDTGVNYSHVDLGNCTSSQFLAGSCDKVPAGTDFYYNDDDPMDNQSHGTHVAGIIASTNGTYRGVAPGARIIAIKACNDQSPAACSVADVISGMDWCINNATRYNISVISMSLGGGLYKSWCDDDGTAGVFTRPVDNATVRNITVVAATGNNANTASISYPACIRNVTAVGGTTKADAFYSSGNRNNITDLVAPGQSITSLYYRGGTAAMSGTSMATPHVAGAMALLRQYFRVSQKVTANATLLLTALNSSGRVLNDSAGSNLNFIRMDPYAAIRAFDSAAPNITFVAPTPADSSNSSSNGSIFINASGTETLFNAFLEWSNGTVSNYSLSGSGIRWSINFSTTVKVNSTYRVFGNDTAGNFGVTGVMHLGFVNSSAPAITSFYPSELVVGIAEPANQTFNVSYSDAEGDAINVTWMQNGTIVSHNIVNFTFVSGYSLANWSRNATYNITVNLTDGINAALLNWTLRINDTNRAPQWSSAPANHTVAENANFSFSVSGFDYDGAVSYHINNTANFTINSTGGNISLVVLESFYGIIPLNVSVSDGLVNVSEVIFVNVTLSRADFDRDGIPDVDDPDDDNDGVPDSEDSILGNATALVVDGSVLSSLSLVIDGSANTSRNLTGPVFVNVSNGSRMLAQFFWNFTASNFSVNFTILTENGSAGRGEIMISNLSLPGNLTKNVTVSNISNASSVCIHDSAVSSISNVSAACNGGSETLVLCPGSSGAYTCSSASDGTLYLVTGLSFSAVVEQCRDVDGDGYGTGCALGADCNDNDASKAASCSSSSSSSSSGSSGGGSGGGGGGVVKKPALNASNASSSGPAKKPSGAKAVAENNATSGISSQPGLLNASEGLQAGGNEGTVLPGRSVAAFAAVMLVLAAAAAFLYSKGKHGKRKR